MPDDRPATTGPRRQARNDKVRNDKARNEDYRPTAAARWAPSTEDYGRGSSRKTGICRSVRR